MKILNSIMVLSCSALLSACGGGGGGAAGPSASLAPFVKFSSIAVPGSVRINGASQEANYTFNNGTQQITNVTAPTSFASGATYDATLDASGNTTKGVFTSAAGTGLTIDTALGGTFTSYFFLSVAATADKKNYLLTPNGLTGGWDYQSFGVWKTGGAAGSGTIGVTTIGAETSGAAIPTSGTGSFLGSSVGQYVDSNGVSSFVASTMTAGVDFSGRSIAFATANTQTVDQTTGVTFPNGNLNTSGTLSYSAGVNQFTGAVTSVGGGAGNAPMSGNATGRFYGPAAQELGGTFSLTNGSAAYLGAFGGKR